MFDFSIRVVGKIIRFKSDSPLLSYNPSDEREFAGFLLYNSPQKADVLFDIKYGMMPDFSGEEVLFHVDQSWSLSRYKDKILFEYPDRNLPGRMERVGEINNNLTEATIYVNREKTPQEEAESQRQRLLQMTEEERRRREERMGSRQAILVQNKLDSKPKSKTPQELGRKVISEIKANFFQAFLVEYVVRKKIGFLIHCSSVQNDNGLYLFMGQSRTGKSTMAGFWHTKANATVFNDDRAVVNMGNGAAYFYNAPWVGTLADKCSLGQGDGTKINRIFFLRQGGYNELRRVNKTEATAKIFQNSFPVFWEKSALNYVIDRCSEIARIVPCYDLGFVNEDSVVSFLQEKLEKPA